MPPREQVVQDGLALPPEDRAYVIEALEESLTDGVEQGWAAEVERRIIAHERGETVGTDSEIVLARIERELAARQRSAAK